MITSNNQHNHQDRNDKIMLSATDASNKQVFKIEEDEEGKTYNLNEEFSDDDEYEDDEDDTTDNKKTNDPDNGKTDTIVNDKINTSSSNSNNINTTVKTSNTNNIDNIDTSMTTSNNITGDKIKIESPDLNIENNYDVHSIAHRIYYKGVCVNLNDIITTKYIKRISKAGILSMIGFGNKKVTEEKYLIFFDEYYIYTIKDIVFIPNQPELRKIGNRYDIRLLQNTSIEVKFN
jgi:hypothetical protein